MTYTFKHLGHVMLITELSEAEAKAFLGLWCAAGWYYQPNDGRGMLFGPYRDRHEAAREARLWVETSGVNS